MAKNEPLFCQNHPKQAVATQIQMPAQTQVKILAKILPRQPINPSFLNCQAEAIIANHKIPLPILRLQYSSSGNNLHRSRLFNSRLFNSKAPRMFNMKS
ncbi:MAG: hypothetical protein JKY99_00675 [Rhizobiales bacterium]|nr:hypothetical protein [Hyphomicrobiales bacterium]